jgi:hypothetical protein
MCGYIIKKTTDKFYIFNQTKLNQYDTIRDKSAYAKNYWRSH